MSSSHAPFFTPAVSPEGRGRALVLRARALGVAPEVGGARAELALGHALKLDPALGVAWRQLGEQRWRRGDLRGARDAFGGALQQVGGARRGHGVTGVDFGGP